MYLFASLYFAKRIGSLDILVVCLMNSSDLINQFESVEANMFQHQSHIVGYAFDATINMFLNEQSLHKSIKMLPPLTL